MLDTRSRMWNMTLLDTEHIQCVLHSVLRLVHKLCMIDAHRRQYWVLRIPGTAQW